MPKLTVPSCDDRKIGLTQDFRFTTILLIFATLLMAIEFRSMLARQNDHFSCKETGVSLNACDHTLGQKWRGERNFYMVTLHFLCWLMVDRLSHNAKQEEAYVGENLIR